MLHFENSDAKLDLTVTSYELSDTYGASPEALNWLVMRATFQEDDVFIKDSNSCIQTFELKEMTAGLKVLSAGLKDRYESDFAEPFFLLQAWKKADTEGFVMAVSFTLPNTMDGNDVAELEAEVTAQELKNMIAELDLYCAKFPERS